MMISHLVSSEDHSNQFKTKDVFGAFKPIQQLKASSLSGFFFHFLPSELPNAQDDSRRPNVISKQNQEENVSRLAIPSSDDEDCDVDIRSHDADSGDNPDQIS